MAPRNETALLILPAEELRGLSGERVGRGATLLTLTAHLRTPLGLVGDLLPAAAGNARDATVALVRGLLADAADGASRRRRLDATPFSYGVVLVVKGRG